MNYELQLILILLNTPTSDIIRRLRYVLRLVLGFYVVVLWRVVLLAASTMKLPSM